MIEDEITEADIAMVRYFLLEKGDIARWNGWEAKRPLFEVKYPELIAAIKQLEIAERTLTAVIKSL